MKKTTALIIAPLLLLQGLTACDSPSALSSTRQEQSLVSVRANILASSNPQQASTVQIPDPDQLPQELREAKQLVVVFDASKTTSKVQRNSDGTLSFALNTSRSFDSDSNLNILMVGDGKITYAIQLKTGTPFELGSPAIKTEPGNTITLGTRMRLEANLQASEASQYVFNWQAATSAAGPWQDIAGSGSAVEWEPGQAGSYYIRLELTDKSNRSRSSYLSPTPLAYVQSSEKIAKTTPLSGAIIAGEELGLSVDLPEYTEEEDLNFQWFYSTSLQAPFQPISGRGYSIRWEPPGAGSYYLRVQASNAGRLSTYTSSSAQVLVASPDEVIATEPAGGSVVRGQAIKLASAVPGLANDASYTWFYAFSPQGPFQPIAETGAEVEWIPPLTGEFYIRLRAFEPERGESRTYTSSETLVSVRDSNDTFTVSPDPANIVRGQFIDLSLNDAPSEDVTWSYGTALSGAFVPIPDTGAKIRWTPPEAGSFYVRAAATRSDGSVANFSSADPLAFVAEPGKFFTTEPSSGNLDLGQSIRLSAQLQEQGSDLRYAWSYSTSAQGPFLPLQTLESSLQRVVTWYPPMAGSYFVKVDVTNSKNQSQLSFISPDPVVRVNQSQPFFSTDPSNGQLLRDDSVRLKARFESGNRTFSYGWAYSASTAGPFTLLGGSSRPEFFWDEDNKPTGTYYLRLEAISPGTERGLTFVSSAPVLFISKSDQASSQFGVAGSSASTTATPF